METHKEPRVIALRTSRYVAPLFLLLTSLVAAGPQETPAVPMRLEIELDSPECVVLENFTLTLRIVNPNAFQVRLPGFEFGYIEPEIHGAGPGFPEGEFRRLYYGVTDSAWRKQPVLLSARGSIEHHRFLFNGFESDRWPIEPAVHYLRPKLHIGQTHADEGEERIPIEWSCETVQFRVRAASAADRRGFAFLTEGLRDYREGTDSAGRRPGMVFRAELFADFLERYGETAYAPEIRWELATTLRAVLENRRERAELDSESESMRVFVDCVKYCLDRGSPYADDLLEWDPQRGKFGLMRFAAKHRLPALLKRLAAEVDRRMPEDEGGILYRRLMVVGNTESYAAAQKVYETLKERYPETQYARMAELTMRSLARRQQRQGDEH